MVIILGDGSQHEKESFISIRKYNSANQEIFNKKYFLKYTKDNLYWAKKVVYTVNGFAIYIKVKKNNKYYNSIINFDKNGNKLWQRYYYGREFRRPYSADILVRNNYLYVISAFRYKGSIFAGHKGLPSFVSIVKLNMNGDEIWAKEYPYDFNIKQVLNTSNNIKVIGNSSNHIYDLTVDSNGKLASDTNFNIDDICDIESVAIANTNHYLAVGNTGIFDDDGCIVELNQYGKPIWNHNYKMATEFNRIFKTNSGYIVTGYASKWFWEDDKKYWSVMKIKNDKEKLSTVSYNKERQGTQFVAPRNSTNIKKQTFNKPLYKKKIYKKPYYKKGTYRVINIQRSSYLNVRSDSGTQYRKIAKLKYNAKDIIILYCVDGWCKIKNKNESYIGWVSSKYLQKVDKVNQKVITVKKRHLKPSINIKKEQGLKE